MKSDSLENRSSVFVYFPFEPLYLRLLCSGQMQLKEEFHLFTRARRIRSRMTWAAFEQFTVWTDAAARKRVSKGRTERRLSLCLVSLSLQVWHVALVVVYASASKRCPDNSRTIPSPVSFIPPCSFLFLFILCSHSCFLFLFSLGLLFCHLLPHFKEHALLGLQH